MKLDIHKSIGICTICGKYKSRATRAKYKGIKAYLKWCKDCCNSYKREYRIKNWERVAILQLNWKAKNKDKVIKWRTKWVDKNTDKIRSNAIKRHKLYLSDPINRAKDNARKKLRYQVRVGLIKKYPCEICGDIKSEAHHKDYSKPLDVIWLCPTHHRLEDIRIGFKKSRIGSVIKKHKNRFVVSKDKIK